jgi:uncharacterized protein
MIYPDTNLLLYAHFSVFPEHVKARRWWEGLLNGQESVAIAVPVLFGFIRVSTNSRVFADPIHVDDVVGTVEGWLRRPHLHCATPGPRHLEIAFRLLHDLGTAGNLTTDAQIAALAIENQGEVHSNDADFGRFTQLRWFNPLR